jgi:hypothetical protein
MTDHWDHDDFDLDLPDLPDDVHAGAPHTGLDLPDDTDDLPDDPPETHHDLPDDQPDLTDRTDTTTADDTAFPPALDVDLPEPVDGFPWIDTTTLGAADPGFQPPLEHVTADELAAYAGIEIPDGADPWTVLAASDDPATAALAQWWTQAQQ